MTRTIAPALLVAVLWAAVAAGQPPADVLRGDEGRAAAAYKLSADDDRFLDEVSRACFLFFWHEVGPNSKMAKDRKLGAVCSIASVGFQLSSLPIGVERGWITREQGRQRAADIFKAYLSRSDNRRLGMSVHFLDLDTAAPNSEGWGLEGSTVDHSLFLAGAMTAAVYFGGEIETTVDRIIRETNWKVYAVAENGLLSMGSHPAAGGGASKPTASTAGGPAASQPLEFLKSHWWIASDEERLTYFMAVGSPVEAHAVPPKLYYQLARKPSPAELKSPPFMMGWPGTPFTYFFAHCWIDYRAMGPDEPGRFGGAGPRVDWFENSRRAIVAHRDRCLAAEVCQTTKLPQGTAWGLNPCAGHAGYMVPSVKPCLDPGENLIDCTISPYSAGGSIVFTPELSIAALRAFRELKREDGKPLVWRDPSEGPGCYGFVDSFCLSRGHVSEDYLGIDQGPMLLAIENLRTGLVWKLFMRHAAAKAAAERLGMR